MQRRFAPPSGSFGRRDSKFPVWPRFLFSVGLVHDLLQKMTSKSRQSARLDIAFFYLVWSHLCSIPYRSSRHDMVVRLYGCT